MGRLRRPKGYDSWFEYDLNNKIGNACVYHSESVRYIQKKLYYPDFTYHDGDSIVLIEAKGRFRDRSEARKYIDIRESLYDRCSLVFIFQNPNTPMPHSPKRRDGSRMTHGDWATKHGFKYYTIDNLPLEWTKM